MINYKSPNHKSSSYSRDLFILFLLYTLMHIPVFLNPSFQYPHIHRQADVAAVARNFVIESMNFFYPRVDIRGNLSGITGMEFPLFNYLVAIIYKITGSTWVGFGKILSYICAIGSIFLLVKLVFGKNSRASFASDKKQSSNLDNHFGIISRYSCGPLLFAIIALLSPFCFRYSSNFMPEFFALFLSLSGFYLFNRYRVRQQKTNKYILFTSAILLLLGMLVRPYYAFFGLPLFIYTCENLISKKWMEGFICALTGLLVLGVFFTWYWYWVPAIPGPRK